MLTTWIYIKNEFLLAIVISGGLLSIVATISVAFWLKLAGIWDKRKFVRISNWGIFSFQLLKLLIRL